MGIQEDFIEKSKLAAEKSIQKSARLASMIIRFSYGKARAAVTERRELGEVSLQKLLSGGKETGSLDPVEKDTFDFLKEHLKKSGIRHSVESWKDSDGKLFFRVTYLARDRNIVNNALDDTMRDISDVFSGRKTRESILARLQEFVQVVNRNKEKEKDREHNLHQEYGAR